MQLALRLARRGYGATSPNPMVGAVLINEAMEADLIAGKLYINLHTPAFPNGEIRGQVASTTAAPPAAAPAPAKTGSGGFSGVSSTSILAILGLVAATGAAMFVGRRAAR